MAFLPLSSRGRDLQLVATLGPASAELAPALAEAGATAFRLNASHLSPEALREAVGRVRRQLPEAPLVIDLQGAKMRLGTFEERPVRAGEGVRFALASTAGDEGFPIPHPELFRAASVDDTLTIDDGRLRFRVMQAGTDRIEALALDDGRLRPRKGVNLLEHPVELEDMTGTDERHCRELAGLGEAAWAWSFMTDGREAAWLRRRVPACSVIGKVERREATTNLGSIARSVEAIWICRGDLGEQLGAGGLARFVASVDPRALEVPVLMAGQVLEHLTRNRQPTRSEICHLHDLISRGYAGIVLSDETAIGDDPVNAVATAAALLRELA